MLEETGRLHAESFHDPHHVDQGNVSLASLDSAHVAPIQANTVRKGLLRVTERLALNSHCTAKLLQIARVLRVRIDTHLPIVEVHGQKYYGR